MVENQSNAEHRLKKLQIAFECTTLGNEAKIGKQTSTELSHRRRIAEGTQDLRGTEAKNGEQTSIEPSNSSLIVERTRDLSGTVSTMQTPDTMSTRSTDGPIKGSGSPLARDLSVHAYSREIGAFCRPEVDALHREELDHHSRLVTAIIDDVNDLQFNVNDHLRQVMWDGNLGLHFDYWSPYRSKYGDAALIDLVSPYMDLVSIIINSRCCLSPRWRISKTDYFQLSTASGLRGVSAQANALVEENLKVQAFQCLLLYTCWIHARKEQRLLRIQVDNDGVKTHPQATTVLRTAVRAVKF